ncbi:IS3 family transposase [Microlunatus elymi]|uniref:IS3 family transposase n=1 Tax=Microlunatus elymi TaxID=2596828 RepID=A0A516PWX7_9ACTN|nr:IS3 family transposase [Microlunatus elymi]QDP95684.1 IS3 family transposase [Microlunatus elymi]
MSVARFIADQRTFYRVPIAVCCAILGLSIGWFYKWIKSPVTDRQQRRRELDAAVLAMFEASGRTYGSPRIHRDLVDAGWRVGHNTVADSMARQGLQGRKRKHRKGLTKQDRKAAKFPDLVRRDFAAPARNRKWCGDITEIPTDEGKLYMATVIDLYSRKLLACPIGDHPDAGLACAAIKIAAAVRGGRQQIEGVIFHSDRGSTYTAKEFTLLCKGKLGIRQSMGRVGSCFDNAAAESFFSTLEHEVLSRHHFETKAQAKEVVLAWCHRFCNVQRRHSSAALLPPDEYEMITADQPAAA